jgi:hypothetical protein
MKKKSFNCRIVGTLLLLGMLAGPVIASAQTVPFDCTPTIVGVFTNRVYVQCSAFVLGTVNQFAVATSDSGMAARFLSAFTTAKVTAKTLRIHYFPGGDGSSFGCVVSNCRPISGVEIQP